MDARIPQHLAVISEVRSVHPVNFRSLGYYTNGRVFLQGLRIRVDIPRIRFRHNKIHRVCIGGRKPDSKFRPTKGSGFGSDREEEPAPVPTEKN